MIGSSAADSQVSPHRTHAGPEAPWGWSVIRVRPPPVELFMVQICGIPVRAL